MDAREFLHQHDAVLASMAAEKSAAAAKKRSKRRRRRAVNDADTSTAACASAGAVQATAAAAGSGDVALPVGAGVVLDTVCATPEVASAARDAAEVAASVGGASAATLQCTAGGEDPSTEPGAAADRGTGGGDGAAAQPRLAPFTDYMRAKELTQSELEAAGVSNQRMEERLRATAVARHARLLEEEEEEEEEDEEEAAAAGAGVFAAAAGAQSFLGKPMTAKAKAAFWDRVLRGGTVGSRSIPVLYCVRQPVPHGAAEVYEFPDQGQGPMDEQTWLRWGELPGNLRPAQPLLRIDASVGMGFQLFGQPGEGGWRSFEVLLGPGYHHRQGEVLHPLRLVCGDRVAVNARGIQDLVHFLRDPLREDVQSHLTNLALGDPPHNRPHTKLARGDPPHKRPLAPVVCHWYLRRRWGLQGLEHVGWGERDTLLHWMGVQQNPEREKCSAAEWDASVFGHGLRVE